MVYILIVYIKVDLRLPSYKDNKRPLGLFNLLFFYLFIW